MRPITGVLRSLGAAGLLVSLTFSCGNDTKSDPDEDGGAGGSASAAGGNGGTANSGNSGGTGGSGGSSTTGGTTNGAGGMSTAASTASSTTNPTTNSSTTGAAGAPNVPEPMEGLADPCETDDDCESDLICISAESGSLVSGGPANGLCTATCDSDNPCGAGAACITFGETAYCMPMCVPTDGVVDCAGRMDAVCDLLPMNLTCTSNGDCPAGAGCLEGIGCVLPVCLPRCGADSDCPEGRFCEPRYGECVDEEPEGSGLDELCDPDADPDECQAFCAAGETESRCAETCSLGAYPACGSSSEENGTAACLAPFLSGAGTGDLGFCVGLCDCATDCAEDMVCVSFESEGFEPPEVHGRPGYCAPEAAEIPEEDLLACED